MFWSNNLQILDKFDTSKKFARCINGEICMYYELKCAKSRNDSPCSSSSDGSRRPAGFRHAVPITLLSSLYSSLFSSVYSSLFSSLFSSALLSSLLTSSFFVSSSSSHPILIFSHNILTVYSDDQCYARHPGSIQQNKCNSGPE